MKLKAKQELKSQEKVLRFVAYSTTESKTMLFHILCFMLQSHPKKVENSIHI